MKKILPIVCVILFLLSASSLNAKMEINDKNTSMDEGTDYWGLFIGVNEYYNCSEDSFIECKLMMNRLVDTLSLSDDWRKENIKVLTDKNTTRKKIIDGFQWLDEHEDEDDICFIAYAGHGMMVRELIPPFDEEDHYDGHLTTYMTSELVSPTSSLLQQLLGTYTSTISDDQLNRLLGRLEAKGICVLIEACAGGEYDDPPTTSLENRNQRDTLFSRSAAFISDFCQDIKGSGRVVLMPCEEYEGVDGTWFVDFITQGLQGYADVNHDALVTAEEAFNYSAPLTAEMYQKYTMFPNTPSIFDNYPGELVISQSELPPSTPEPILGPSLGEKGISYTFKTSATEPDDDDVRYYIEWGDGIKEYSQVYSSGEIAELSHSWDKEGVFNFYVYSEDEHGARSILAEKHIIIITDEDNVDQIQLNQSFYQGWFPVSKNMQIAQSFKPQRDRITKIALPLYSRGYDSVHLQIKKNLDDEENIAEACAIIPPTQSPLVNGVQDWTVFDIPDIQVTITETYYLSCYTHFMYSSQWRNIWGCNLENVYQDGKILYSLDNGEHWEPITKQDACFVIYGK